MKYLNTKFIWVLIAGVLFSCDEDPTENTSTITYYPIFEMMGEPLFQLSVDATFDDPGVIATEQGEQIDYDVSFVGRFSGYSGETLPNEADEYHVVYSAVNRDGFAGTTERTVVKVNTDDFTSGIGGWYNATVVRSTGVSYSDIKVLVWEVSPDVFEISSGIGGYYGEGSGFGDGYLARGGTVTVNDLATNDFTYGQMQFPTWGNVADITTMAVDAAARTISYHVLADFGGEWDITLVQVQP